MGDKIVISVYMIKKKLLTGWNLVSAFGISLEALQHPYCLPIYMTIKMIKKILLEHEVM